MTLQGGTELERGAEALDQFESALDEWLLLTAAALVGMGAAAHEEVCRYAAERRAFGGIIGGYQGVAHPLADDATNLDGARLLVRKAAWALDVGDRRGRELAAMAFAFASEAAERATYDAIHFHGGYGFMLEHDAQLFYRRARTWARVWGDAEDGYRRAAAARYGSVAAGGRLMDFAWGPEVEALRTEIRAFLAEHLPPALEDELYTSGVAHDDDFARALGERNWIAPEWPRDGFEAMDPLGVHVLLEELTKADAPTIAVSTSMMVARVIAAVGSEELKADILPKVVRGELLIALGMSEPEAGSDVAAVQTRAKRGRGRLDHRRAEDVHDERPSGRLCLPARPDRSGQRAPPRPHDVPGAGAHRGLRGAGGLHRVR